MENSSGNDVFVMPGANRVTLTGELAEDFRNLRREAAGKVVEMCVLAHAVRAANINQSGDYNKSFSDWYSQNNMDRVFGGRPNFTKYASAGQVIFNNQKLLGKDLSQLPLAVSALYEIHDMTPDEMALCVEDHYTRDSITVTDKIQYKKKYKKPTPVIHGNATAASIKNWIKNWRTPPKTKSENRTVPFIQIFAHGSVYNMDKNTFEPTGKVTVTQLEEIQNAIIKTLGKTDEYIRVNSDFEKIKEGVTRRRNAAQKKMTKKLKMPIRKSSRSTTVGKKR